MDSISYLYIYELSPYFLITLYIKRIFKYYRRTVIAVYFWNRNSSVKKTRDILIEALNLFSVYLYICIIKLSVINFQQPAGFWLQARWAVTWMLNSSSWKLFHYLDFFTEIKTEIDWR
jgi:hypothetical protein